MNPYEKEVAVLGIYPTVEMTTGLPIYYVSFGSVVDMTPEIANRIGLSQPLTAKAKPASMMVWFKCDGEVPYRVGSKWKMTVAEDGQVSLTQAGETH
ncbi:MAG: hypothetical protein ABSF63_15055 [Candidatus Bathyarchaeia archaeon]|jgi:hypothetical protein